MKPPLLVLLRRRRPMLMRCLMLRSALLVTLPAALTAECCDDMLCIEPVCWCLPWGPGPHELMLDAGDMRPLCRLPPRTLFMPGLSPASTSCCSLPAWPAAALSRRSADTLLRDHGQGLSTLSGEMMLSILEREPRCECPPFPLLDDLTLRRSPAVLLLRRWRQLILCSSSSESSDHSPFCEYRPVAGVPVSCANSIAASSASSSVEAAALGACDAAGVGVRSGNEAWAADRGVVDADGEADSAIVVRFEADDCGVV